MEIYIFFSFTLFIKNQEGHFFSFLTQKKKKIARRCGLASEARSDVNPKS
jgi:hypothetical protein